MEKKRGKGALSFLKSKGRPWLIGLGVVLGILLLFLGNGVEKGTTKTEAEAVTHEEGLADLLTYQKTLEHDLAELCDAVAGVSHVEVAVTLGSGTRVVYATNEKSELETVGSGSAQKPVYRTVEPPLVAGVGVVCRGGNDPHVQSALTELLSTTLGIPTNRVFVTGK